MPRVRGLLLCYKKRLCLNESYSYGTVVSMISVVFLIDFYADSLDCFRVDEAFISFLALSN